MKAAMFDAPGKPLLIERVADPVPEAEDLILAVTACGICGSDLHMADADGSRGMPPLPHGTIMGHEFAGTVAAAGSSVRDAWPIGTRVTALPALGCGRCLACLAGSGGRCERGVAPIGLGRYPGAYAEFLRVRAHETLRIPNEVDDRHAATVEPLAVGLHAVYAAALQRGDRVLVMGAGPIGLAVAHWARFFGARRVLVTDLVPARLALADAMGATDTLDAAEATPARVRELFGAAPDLIFECVGVPGMQQRAIEQAPVNGRLVIVGVCMEYDRITPVHAIVKELSVRYVIGYERADFAFTLEMLASGRASSTPMISGSVGFADFSATFERLKHSKDECKIILEPSSI